MLDESQAANERKALVFGYNDSCPPSSKQSLIKGWKICNVLELYMNTELRVAVGVMRAYFEPSISIALMKYSSCSSWRVNIKGNSRTVKQDEDPVDPTTEYVPEGIL